MSYEVLLQEALTRLSDAQTLRRIRPRPNGIVQLAGNDYLGAGADAALREAFFDSDFSRYGLSSGSSPLLFGESEAHERLHEVLRTLFGREALLFPSGWQLNTGFLSALGTAFGKNCFFLADRLVHASMIDGLLAAQRSGTNFRRFPHNDVSTLERLLEQISARYELVVILTESVFSMDGDVAPLRELAALKQRFPNVLLAVDDAHGIGIEGECGTGPVETAGIADAVDFRILTFGKAAASSGAAFLAKPEWLSLLTNYARPLIFSTAESPLQAAWTAFVLSHFPLWESRRATLRRHESTVLAALGRNRSENTTPILPVILGGNDRTLRWAVRLEEEGFLVSAVRPPTVPFGSARLRISLSAALCDEEVERFASTLATLRQGDEP